MDIIALGDAPYFDLYLTLPSGTEVLTYVDTTEQELMYEPQTYILNYTSNLSSKRTVWYVGTPITVLLQCFASENPLRLSQFELILHIIVRFLFYNYPWRLGKR